MSIVLEMIEVEREAWDAGEVSLADLRVEYQRLVDSERPDLERLLVLGREFEEKDLTEEAIHCYSRVIALDGNNAEALARRGNITFGLFVARDMDGNERELARWSVSDFEKAVQSAGNNFSYVKMLGLALLVFGNYERARKLSEAALAGSKDTGETWDFLYVLGYSQLFGGQVVDALTSFGRLSEKVSDLDDGWFGQALCFWRLGSDDLLASARKHLSVSGDERLSILLERGFDNYLAVARALL